MRKADRDFIDFAIELYSKKYIFFVMLIISVGIASFSYQKNKDNYTANTNIVISKESSFVKILCISKFYRENIVSSEMPLQGNDSVIYTSNLNSQRRTYESIKADVCKIIHIANIDNNFFNSIAKSFMDSEFYDKSLELKLSDVSSDVMSSLDTSAPQGICINVEFGGNYALVNFLKDEYNNMLNNYIRKEMHERLTNIRNEKVSYLKVLLQSQSSAEKSTIDSINHRLYLFDKRPINDSAHIQYFTHQTSDIYKVVSLTFTMLLATFLAMVLFVLSVILIDFKSQLISRKLHSG